MGVQSPFFFFFSLAPLLPPIYAAVQAKSPGFLDAIVFTSLTSCNFSKFAAKSGPACVFELKRQVARLVQIRRVSVPPDIFIPDELINRHIICLDTIRLSVRKMTTLLSTLSPFHMPRFLFVEYQDQLTNV